MQKTVVNSAELGLAPLLLQNHHGLKVEILPWGATISSILWHGQELTLRQPSLADYQHNPGYLGASIGRYANRIAGGKLQFRQQIFTLDTAGGEHCLHGGQGFSQRLWQVLSQSETEVELFLHSPAGDSGFPGDLSVWQQIKLVDCAVSISYRASTESATVVNLTNHCYFNLDGSAQCSAAERLAEALPADSSQTDTAQHWLQIYSDQFLPVTASLIPTGQRQPVAGSAFDFRQPCRIAERLALADPQLALTGGFDHCFIVDNPEQTLRPVAKLTSARQDLSLTVSSTMPGLQFYGGHALGAPFTARQGLCLEAQFWPDAPNRADFPSTTLQQGQLWQQQIVYAFERHLVEV